MRKLFAIACIALVAAFAAPAFADNEFNISLDAWFVNIAGVHYEAGHTWPCTNSDPGDPYYGDPDCPKRYSMTLDGEGDVTPVLNFTWIRDNANGLGLTYYKVEGESSFDYRYGDDTEFYIMRSHSWSCGWCNDEWYSSQIEASFMELDLRYIRVLKHDSADSWWRASFGFTLADFEQTDSQYLGFENTNVGYEGFDPWYRVDIGAEWSGWGPSVGIEGSQRLFMDNFRFQGSLQLAYLSGTSDYRYRDGFATWDGNEYVFVPSYGNDPYIFVAEERDANVMKMDISLGLEYEFSFGLLIRGGYRLTHWSNLPSFDVTVDNTYDGWIESVFGTRDISTEGFYLGAGYSWGGGE